MFIRGALVLHTKLFKIKVVVSMSLFKFVTPLHIGFDERYDKV